jgi:hypothetical protein
MRKVMFLATVLALCSLVSAAKAQEVSQVAIPSTSGCGYASGLTCNNLHGTVDGLPVTIYVQLGSVGGYVYFSNMAKWFPVSFIQVVSVNYLGLPTELKVSFSGTADPDGEGDQDSVQGMLDLTITWTRISSGGGRGSHNYINIPTVSGTGTYSY